MDLKPRLHEQILFDKFYFICQRYFARADDKFVTNLL